MHDSILFPEGITPFPACFHARGNAGSRHAGAGAGRRLNDLLAVDVLDGLAVLDYRHFHNLIIRDVSS